MTGRLGAGAAASFAVAAVLAGISVVLSAGAAQAVPQALPLQASFTDLRPGDVRSTSWPVHIPQQAKISQAVLHRDGPGDVRWTAQLCPVAGTPCLDVMTAAVGTPIAAGDYELQVGLTVVDLQPGQSQSLEGRYTLVEDDDGLLADTSGGGPVGRPVGGLASTGASALPLGATAVAVATLGVLLVVLSRRREAPDPDAPRAGDTP